MNQNNSNLVDEELKVMGMYRDAEKNKGGLVKNRKKNNFLDKLLRAKGMTKADLSREIGVGRAYISSIINGLLPPPENIKIKIAKYFEMDSKVLFEEQDG